MTDYWILSAPDKAVIAASTSQIGLERSGSNQ